MKQILKPVLLAGLLISLSCKNEKTSNQLVGGNSLSAETEVSDLGTEPKVSKGLVINSGTLLSIQDEFKVDPYEATEKYGGKEAKVSIGFASGQLYVSQDKLLYTIDESFHGLPIIKTNHLLRMGMDISSITKGSNLQGYIQLTDGDISAMIGEEPLGPNDKWYIFYNKKTGNIYTGRDHYVSLLAGYVRVVKNNGGRDIIDPLLDYMNQEDAGIVGFLKSGDLYYVEFDKDGKIDIDDYLLPCEYTFSGILSKDIREIESVYGVRKIDLNLVSPKLIDTKYFIDKNKFFTKQIK